MASPSSSLTFHHLDHVFLQSQARIWLEKMLHTRFDELISICDLLADGELLFEVSKTLWNLLLVKYMELNNYKTRLSIPLDKRRSSGRYRPYSNVDSFLKVCKVLGLSGIDLFSPSDVVEKRDTRKVCICIRSLSKKARSKQLNVPDFDNVTNTLAMPTDVVRCIRKSLELSTSSVIHGQSKHTRLKSRQKSSVALYREEDESCYQESDDSKSNCSDISYADFLYLESEGSPNIVDNYSLTQGKENDEVRNQEMDNFFPPGSAESLFLQYSCSDNQLDGISSSVCESRLIICDEFTPVNDEAKFPFRILTKAPFHISGDCMCPSCMGTESHNSNTTPNPSIYRVRKKFPDDVEASPSSSVSSVVGRVLDFGFDFDAPSEPDDLKTLVLGSRDQSKRGNLDQSGDSFSPCWEDEKSYYVADRTKAADKDERKDVRIDCLAETDTNENRTFNKEKKSTSTYIAPLLKTVVKGTALIGIFFFLHFRNSGDRYTNNKSTRKSSQIHWKSSGVVFSTRKGETGNKIYPVEKFKFGDL